LKNLDVDLGRVRQTVFKLIQPGPEGEVVIGKLPQTPRAKKVIEYAMEESRRLEHNYVGSEHILLGLLREEEGVAAQVLMNLGLKLDTVRAEVLSLLGHPSNDSGSYIPQSTAEVALKPVETVREFLYHPRRSDSVGTTCPKCGAQLVRILWNRTHLNPEELQEVSAQRAILAHKPGRNTPFWVCSTCEPRWSEVHRLALQDYQWQRAKEEAVLQEQYETAIQLRDQQRELRPRLMALVEELLGGA
jgi:ATP-dependent Clp protease ATP-binding subunit ClpA